MAMQLSLFPALRGRHEIPDMAGEVMGTLSSSVAFLLNDAIKKFRTVSKYHRCQKLTYRLGVDRAVHMLQSRISERVDIL